MKLNGSITISTEKLTEVIQKYIRDNNVSSGQIPTITFINPVVVEKEMNLGCGYGTASEFQGIKVFFEVESDIAES